MTQTVLRRLRIGVLVVAVGISVLAVILVLGAWRNDRTIESNMGLSLIHI